MSDCIFCKIVNKQATADLVYSDEEVIAFRDILPKAPVHVLVVPRRHIGSVAEFESEDMPLAGKLVMAAKNIAQQLGVSENGYKLVFNVGRQGGQIVPHVHLHLLGGKQLE